MPPVNSVRGTILMHTTNCSMSVSISPVVVHKGIYSWVADVFDCFVLTDLALDSGERRRHTAGTLTQKSPLGHSEMEVEEEEEKEQHQHQQPVSDKSLEQRRSQRRMLAVDSASDRIEQSSSLKAESSDEAKIIFLENFAKGLYEERIYDKTSYKFDANQHV